MRLGTFFMPASQLGAHTSHFSSPLFCFFPSTAGGICHRAAPRVHQQTTGRPHCSPQSEITHITLAPAAQSAKFPPKEHPRAPGSKLVHVRERRALWVRWRISDQHRAAPQAQRHTRAKLGHVAVMDMPHWAMGACRGVLWRSSW